MSQSIVKYFHTFSIKNAKLPCINTLDLEAIGSELKN